MAYEAEKQRLFALIQQQTGITRTWNADLAREADERAYEGYLEVGTGPQPDGTFKGISHPTQVEREARLGADWSGKGVAEIAVWHFGYDEPPEERAITAWMNSAAHRNVLTNAAFKYIGIGIFTHKGSADTELWRRWYIIAWLSVDIPTSVTPEEDMILLPIQLYPAGTKAQFSGGTQYSFYRVVNGKLERKNWTPTSNTSASLGARTALNGDTAKAGYYILDGIHAGWVLSGWTPPAGVVEPIVHPDRTAEVNSLNAAIDNLEGRIARKNTKADELKAI